MSVIINGAGGVGFYLAKMLSNEGRDIVVIDQDPAKVQRVQESLDVMAIEGNGTRLSTLLQAGIKNAEMFIAVTNVDEVNIVACILANKLGVPKKVARVRHSDFLQEDSLIKPEELGIDLMIHPEEVTAREIVRLLKRSFATDIIEFKKQGVQVVGIRVDSRNVPIVGKPLKVIMQEHPEVEFRTVAINRNGRTIIPKGDDMIFFKDQIFVISKDSSLPAVLKLVGKEDQELRKAMILGGGRIGRLVAEEFEKLEDVEVKLVESRLDKSFQIATKLKKTLVIQGDGTDIDLLASEGIGDMDSFIALTDDDETNLVSCLLAKHLGIKKAIALLDKADYVPLANTIGLDAAVSSKMITADAILRFIRRGRILSVSTLHDIEAEVIELAAGPDSKITKKQLKDIKFPKGAIVGAICRNNKIEIPLGESQVQPDDHLIVFALPESIPEVEKVCN